MVFLLLYENRVVKDFFFFFMPLKVSFIIACFELSFFENHSNVMVQYV